jgi:hypothetical protein
MHATCLCLPTALHLNMMQRCPVRDGTPASDMSLQSVRILLVAADADQQTSHL